MSQIFDGLQRLEAERYGTDPSALPTVTELLRVSEGRVASRPDKSVPSSMGGGTGTGEVDSPNRLPAEAVAVQAYHPNNNGDFFDNCPSLQVCVAPQNRLVCFIDAGEPAAEAFRLLSVRLRDIRHIRPLKTVLITSTIPQEGKSMVAANLACSLSLGTQQRVLLLEGDLRRPSLSHIFGLGKNPGLSERLQDDQPVAAYIYRLEGSNVWILPSGSAPTDAAELLRSGRLMILMDQLKGAFDWIVIDSPPILPLADTSIWMRLSDGILLITREGITEKKQLQRGLDAIEPKKLIGAVLNSSKHSSDGYYYYATASTPVHKA
jgi:capsular exopolysaccharide synthesis family protein